MDVASYELYDLSLISLSSSNISIDIGQSIDRTIDSLFILTT